MKTLIVAIYISGLATGWLLGGSQSAQPDATGEAWELVLVLPTPNGGESFASLWGTFEDCIEEGFRADSLGLQFGSCSLVESE